MKFKDSVLIDAKASYVKKPKKYGEQDTEKCIICKIIMKDEDTPTYEIFRNDLAIVFLNLYPTAVLLAILFLASDDCRIYICSYDLKKNIVL